jgi:hypothetical protein
MAMESERVTADVIEANEFPTLSATYAVQAVPKTVVNDQVEFLGAMPEGRFVQEVWRAVPADGEAPNGEAPNGEAPNGEAPNGEAPNGEAGDEGEGGRSAGTGGRA